MTATVNEADADVAKAKAGVQKAEDDILSGRRKVSAGRLHELRDHFRHSQLTAEAARRHAADEHAAARMTGLEQVGAEVDELATGETNTALAEALRDLADAAQKVRAIAAVHDAATADLVAAAEDLQVERATPGGPRATSAFVAIDGQSITHRRTKVSPLGERIHDAIHKAVSANLDGALAAAHIASQMREPMRPDHLLRGRGGALIAVNGPLSPVLETQIRSRETERLSEHEVDRYMAGELS